MPVPGDPGLITARGLKLVRSCDVVVYDRLVSEEMVAEAPADAIRIPPVGASIERVFSRQAKLEQQLVRVHDHDQNASTKFSLRQASIPCPGTKRFLPQAAALRRDAPIEASKEPEMLVVPFIRQLLPVRSALSDD